MPQNWTPSYGSPGEPAEKDEPVGGLMPIFAASSSFKRIEAKTPDGKTLVGTIKGDGYTIEEFEPGSDVGRVIKRENSAADEPPP
jgi:hypothetical protein